MLFGPKKLPRIPSDLVSYIQIETEANRTPVFLNI